MNIDISTRHGSLPEAVKEHILDRGQRMSRILDGVSRCEFVLDEDAAGHHCEIKIHAVRSDLTAKAVHSDVYAAIDAALDKIEEQLRRLKDKLRDHHRGEKGIPAPPASDEPREPTYEEAMKEEL